MREGLVLSLPVSLGLLFAGFVFAISQRRGRLREQALKVSLQRNMQWLEGAQKAAAIGYFAYEAGAETFTMSTMARTIFGLEGEGAMPLRQWVVLIHPECRKEVLAQHEQAMSLHRPLRVQYRICRASDQ
ncbi:MAG: sensor domain-containing diguanylate cyclase, partial [Simplicispira sp.]|nr:sensor domain-containing diguanylate cyclase [Simplicispira sp.]